MNFIFLHYPKQNSKKSSINEIEAEVFDKNVRPIGSKVFYSANENSLLTNWIKRIVMMSASVGKCNS
jgi:hypothetical protein